MPNSPEPNTPKPYPPELKSPASNSPEPSSPEKVCEILDALSEMGQVQKEVSISDILRHFGDRSYGPVLFVPALIGISPIGAIPGVPAFLALVIAVFATQAVFGRSHLWLPGMLGRRHVDGDKLAAATQKLGRMGRRLDQVFHGRLERMTDDPFPRFAAIVTLVLCVIIVPLELLPFAVFLPMGAIAALGLALTVRDGLLMLVSLGAALLAGYYAFGTLGAVFELGG